MSETGKVRTSGRLALAGLAPFVLCVLTLLASAKGGDLWQMALGALRIYAIAVLSFLGGIRWGAALERANPLRIFAASLLPAVTGFATVFMPPVFALAVLVMAFAAQGAWDVMSALNGSLPGWFGELRMKLTLLVAGALLVALLAVA
jgi:Protein of unknown function (DUF3429)